MGMQDQQKPTVHMPTQRVISLLEALADAEHGLTLTQLSLCIGSSKGTISPILETLQRDFHFDRPNTGIAFTIPISGISL